MLKCLKALLFFMLWIRRYSAQSRVPLGSMGRIRPANKDMPREKLKRANWIIDQEQIEQKGANPRFVLENALQIGTPREIIQAYDALRSQPDEMSKLSHEYVHRFLKRLAIGHFMYLGEQAYSQVAVTVRNDYQKNSGEKFSDPELDALVIKCFKFSHPERVDEAIRLGISFLKTCPEDGKVKIYNAILNLLGNLDLIDAAKELFTRMMNAGIDLTGTFDAMCQAYAKNGQLEEAEKMYEMMKSQDLNPSLWSVLELLDGYALKGDITKANKYFSLIPAENYPLIRAKGYAGLIRVYSERGLPGDALKAYRRGRSEGINLPASCYEHLIRAHLQNKDITASVRWFYKKENVANFMPSMGMYAALGNIKISNFIS